MTERPDAPAPAQGDDPTSIFDGAFRIVVVLAAVMVVLIVLRALGGGGDGGTTGSSTSSGVTPSGSAATAGTPAGPAVDPLAFLDPFPRPAPDLRLTGPDGQPVSLASYRDTPVLVFFGYTHCPDVCPVTIGTVGESIAATGGGARAIFVSVDPERDTVPWLAEFVKYMPDGFTGVTGTPAEIRSTADDWGVRYARVDEGDPANYSMSHTADVFVIDGDGRFRARLPFGTDVPTMTAVIEAVAATPGASASAAEGATPSITPATTASPSASGAASASPAAAGSIWPQVVSSSVWAGGSSPVILALFDDAGGRLDDAALDVTAQVLDPAGAPLGPIVDAVAVQPVGISDVSFVPTIDLPAPGRWKVAVTATAADGEVRSGIADVTALDPGGTAPLGAPAPTIRTPTSADVGGDLTWVTTDPLPDPRLSQTSTADALASGEPFVLVADSVRFRVTPVCGRAVVMAKQLLDRWRTIPFIHHEPYRYSVVTTEPVLDGSIDDPRLTDVAEAWGVGSAPWGVASMPWIFVVDGDGIVRAKYQGVMGTADVDVLLSMLTQDG